MSEFLEEDQAAGGVQPSLWTRLIRAVLPRRTTKRWDRLPEGIQQDAAHYNMRSGLQYHRATPSWLLGWPLRRPPISCVSVASGRCGIGEDLGFTDARKRPDDDGFGMLLLQSAEVSRRRQVVLAVAAGCTLPILPLVSRLSISWRSVPTQTCEADFGTDSADVATFPCEFQRIEELASWRWPALAATLVIIAMATAVLWWLQPRRIQPASPSAVTPLKGRQTHGRLSLRIAPLGAWLRAIGGAAFIVPGLNVALRPSDAPFGGVLLTAIGVILAWASRAGIVIATPVSLRIRSQIFWTNWSWDEVKSVEVIDMYTGPAKLRRRGIVVTTIDGRTWTREAVTSPASRGRPSRADRLLEALRPYAGARITS